MSISLDGYDYGTSAGTILHGPIVAPEFDLQESVQTWFGVLGAAVLYGTVTTRILTMEVTFYGFATEALLRTDVATTQSKVRDNGTLTVDGIDWPQSAFLGFSPSEGPWKDGSGQHGFIQRGQLRFRQIAV